MIVLATLNSKTDISLAEFTRRRGGRKIRTYPSEILPDQYGVDPCPDLDRSLRSLICICRATDPQNVPTISALASLVHTAIVERDEHYYEGDEVEADDIIQTLLKIQPSVTPLS
ncbi:hypothetical protein SLS62_003030 [Diatrype stigma]|uniref:Uncharacterized protein n=1 Tax=Diatrype stigma TaxID=117547 RepID=A0AAN9UVZ2_9PEZI